MINNFQIFNNQNNLYLIDEFAVRLLQTIV